MGLPRGWRDLCIREVAEVTGGLTKNAKRDLLPRRVPYLTVANVYANRLELDNIGTIGVQDSELERVALRTGDLLVVEGNGSLSQLGRVAVWNGEVDGCVHQNHLIKVRPKTTVTSRWLLYWLMSSEGRQAIEAVGSSTSGLHTLSISKVEGLPVRICSVAEQGRIVAEIETQFSRLDATESRLRRALANLKRARASVLKAAVEGRLVPTEAELAQVEGRPYSSVAKVLAEVPKDQPRQVVVRGNNGEGLGGLPEGWVRARIDQISSEPLVNGRSVPTREGGFAVLRLTAMDNGRLDISASKGGDWTAEDAAPWTVKSGDFFIMRGNGSIGRVGCAAIAGDVTTPVAFPDTMIRFRMDQQVSTPRYMLAVWMSPSMRAQIEKSARTTAGIYKINQASVASYVVPLPPLAEQHRIVAEVDRRLSVLDRVEARITTNLARCKRLRQAILKRAFDGRLVSQDPANKSSATVVAPMEVS